jgi:hypothetical protein
MMMGLFSTSMSFLSSGVNEPVQRVGRLPVQYTISLAQATKAWPARALQLRRERTAHGERQKSDGAMRYIRP